MGIKVLLVESDSDTANQLLPSLERNGYEVIQARTQRQALSRGQSVRPDMLIIDVVSFGTHGLKLSDAVRSRLDGVPCVLLLAKVQASLVGDSGHFLTPPFTGRRLLHRLKRLATGVQTRELRAGPFTFDPDTRVLTKGEAVFRLRPKEASLLAVLMQNQGKVFSRQDLMKHVWLTEYMGDTRTLSVHICWLRGYLEDNPRSPVYLRTVRGIGYRFQIPSS